MNFLFCFSGIDFEGLVVGMAGIGTICGLSSTGVNMVRRLQVNQSPLLNEMRRLIRILSKRIPDFVNLLDRSKKGSSKYNRV